MADGKDALFFIKQNKEKVIELMLANKAGHKNSNSTLLTSLTTTLFISGHTLLYKTPEKHLLLRLYTAT